jgi:DNA-binding IclR family transcriptional regulator
MRHRTGFKPWDVAADHAVRNSYCLHRSIWLTGVSNVQVPVFDYHTAAEILGKK